MYFYPQLWTAWGCWTKNRRCRADAHV